MKFNFHLLKTLTFIAFVTSLNIFFGSPPCIEYGCQKICETKLIGQSNKLNCILILQASCMRVVRGNHHIISKKCNIQSITIFQLVYGINSCSHVTCMRYHHSIDLDFQFLFKFA